MNQSAGELKREIGLFHAVMLGLGSILGTGVFVSIGIAAGIAGPAVLVAIVLAGLLALCNGLSSAQLAAAHPVAGGTYEYGYKFLHPKLGFTAGWMFLLAKSASAATAALVVAAFAFNHHIGTELGETQNILHALFGIDSRYRSIIVAILVILLVTVFVLCGLRRTTSFNLLLVMLTVAGLVSFVVFQVSTEVLTTPIKAFQPGLQTVLLNGWAGFASSTALLFVAYTGYGRIATLGEEVHDPRRTIPRAILATLGFCVLMYLSVGYVLLMAGVGTSSHLMSSISRGENPDIFLETLHRAGSGIGLRYFVALAAVAAMVGVLLNLVLGLSRVALAMGRRCDLPHIFSSVNSSGTTPVPAVIMVAVMIASLAVLGNVKATWSFSAFTVLIYYGITNLAALKLPVEHRMYPRAFSWAGLAGCLFLAWWVEPIYWIVGSGLIILGLIWHSLAPKMFGRPPLPGEKCLKCGYDLRASVETCPECGAAIPDRVPVDTPAAN